VLAIVAQAVDASEADQALITTQFATLLEVVWPGSASPLSRLSLVLAAAAAAKAARQHRRLIPGTQCSARRGLRALDRMVDLGPGGIYGPNTDSFHH
jgi:hypothetical protein